MFDCPKCGADRSTIAPVAPCPSCGAALPRPAARSGFTVPPPSAPPLYDDAADSRDTVIATSPAHLPPPPAALHSATLPPLPLARPTTPPPRVASQVGADEATEFRVSRPPTSLAAAAGPAIPPSIAAALDRAGDPSPAVAARPARAEPDSPWAAEPEAAPEPARPAAPSSLATRSRQLRPSSSPPQTSAPDLRARSSAPSATPPPVAAAEGTDVRTAAPAARAEWKAAHPSAKRWAEHRRESGRRAPDPARIVLGLALVGLGAWLLLSFFPGHKPLNARERAAVARQAGVDEHSWRYPPSSYQAARALAVLLITAGSLAALRGAVFRRRVEVACRRCRAVVAADRVGLALRCTQGRHSAGLNASALALGLAIVGLASALLAVTALASFAPR